MEKTIKIGGIDVRMKATAMTSLLYSDKFVGKDGTPEDLFAEMAKLTQAITAGKGFGNASYNVLPKVAYIMAKQADPTITDDVGEWLDQFGMMDIFNAMDQIVLLWDVNTAPTAKPKKK